MGKACFGTGIPHFVSFVDIWVCLILDDTGVTNTIEYIGTVPDKRFGIYLCPSITVS